MQIVRKLDYITEFFLWLLAYGLTFSNAMTEICIGFIVLLFFIKRIILRDARVPQTPLNLFIYAFFVIVAISWLRSSYFAESLRGLLRVPKYAVLFFAVFEFLAQDERRMTRFFWVIIGVSCFTFLNALFQHFYGYDILRHRSLIRLDYQRRLMASFVHPNDFGAYIIFVLPLTLTLLCPRISKRKRLLLAVILLLGLYCLVRTVSRGAWLGFVIGVTVFFFYYKRRMAIIVPLLVIVVIMVAPHGLERLQSLFAAEHNTVWERIQLWKGTWNMIEEHPFLGFGVNTYSKYFPQYKPPDYPDVRYAHNSYLQLWSEIGIFGLLAFLGIIWRVLYPALRVLRGKLHPQRNLYILIALVAGCIGFLIQAGLDTTLHSLVHVTQFWIISAFIVALTHSKGISLLCQEDTQ